MPEDSHSPNSKSLSSRKLIALSATGLLLGYGLCGLAQIESDFSFLLSALGSILGLVSLFALVVEVVKHLSSH